MFPFERREIILDASRRSKRVTTDELLQLTGSSIATLRRDINYLLDKGNLKKFRGGVFYVEKPELKGNFLYKHRMKLFYREKEAIGIAAQEFIKDGDVLVLLYGTTTIHVARQIDPNKNITLITNGIDIVDELRHKPNIKVIVLGGIIDYSNNCIEGPTVPKMLCEFNPSKVILGAGGITGEKGITNYEFLGSTTVSEIVKLVKERIVVADHSKFGRNVLTNVMPLSDVSVFITDSGIQEKYIGLFKDYSIDYRIADIKSPSRVP
ncbi:MAG: DeoR/GlpR transcriptional regulator [Desulfobacteraceae bacterium]|jgi:DeoR/GlpR family transcriptional regulator of sugar metabolism|nr:MAG: DeoR/GlpR transcriptional regulator [Desulfobacteraceae bacterium]